PCAPPAQQMSGFGAEPAVSRTAVPVSCAVHVSPLSVERCTVVPLILQRERGSGDVTSRITTDTAPMARLAAARSANPSVFLVPSWAARRAPARPAPPATFDAAAG